MNADRVAALFRLDAVGEWSRERVREAAVVGPIPAYGSPEWSALPAGDPRRGAAVIVAAECWRRDDPAGPWAEALRQAEQDGAYAARVADDEQDWRARVQPAIRALLDHMARIDRARAAGTDDVGVPL
nr:hypothetical protein [Micromonospora sp. DSM 115978]